MVSSMGQWFGFLGLWLGNPILHGNLRNPNGKPKESPQESQGIPTGNPRNPLGKPQWKNSVGIPFKKNPTQHSMGVPIGKIPCKTQWECPQEKSHAKLHGNTYRKNPI
jgi:hypothetical protein